MNTAFLINYCHAPGNVFYNGTFSLIDGDTKGTWSVTRGNQKTDTSVSLNEDQFRDIWDGFNEVTDFEKNVITSPDVKMDFINNHVIGIIFTFDGNKRESILPHSQRTGIQSI